MVRASKKSKISQHLNYRNLIKVETFLSFAFASLFLSAKITGFAVENTTSSNVAKASLVFLFLGLLGLITLFLSKTKAR